VSTFGFIFNQRWEKASSFGFSAMDFSVGKKPNVLDCAVGFSLQRTDWCMVSGD